MKTASTAWLCPDSKTLHMHFTTRDSEFDGKTRAELSSVRFVHV